MRTLEAPLASTTETGCDVGSGGSADTAAIGGRSPGVEAWVRRGEALAAAEASRRATMRTRRFDTIAAHGIYDMTAAAANQGSIIEPVYLTPAQHFVDSDELEAALAYLIPAWGYTRIANPTLHYLEETLALLESYGTGIEATACVTGSGMAAVHMATNPFLAVVAGSIGRPNIVASAKCYGGTFMLFSERYGAERGVDVRWIADPLDLTAWEAAIDEDTRFVYGELPSNPALGMIDVPAVAALAHTHGLPFIVDSTVATPALLRPLGLGADIVVHSLSKAIGSSGLAIGGALIGRRGIPSRVGPDELRDNPATWIKLQPGRDHGGSLSPMSAAAILADLRTLRTRMDAWSRSALRIAHFLADHPAVAGVAHPGLTDHPGHAIARRDMTLVDGDAEGLPANRYGTLMAFTVREGSAAARRVLDHLELIWRATDLGRVKSVATIPAISTHQQQGETGRAIADVSPAMIRLSVGGEHPDDVIADLDRALAWA